MTILPTGEQLPEYDDEPAVDPAALREWLRQKEPLRWGSDSVPDLNDAHDLQPEQVRMLAEYESVLIADVLQALQAVGDAQLVKNPTYRAMVKDRADLERIGAALHRAGRAEEMAVFGVVGATVKWIDDAVALAQATLTAAARLRDAR